MSGPAVAPGMPSRTVVLDLYGDEEAVILSGGLVDRVLLRTDDGYRLKWELGKTYRDGSRPLIFTIDYTDRLPKGDCE